MGYTHYWRRRKSIPQPVFNAIVRDFRKVMAAIEEKGVRVCGGDGSGKPHVGKDSVSLNGCGNESLETFSFPRIYKPMYNPVANENNDRLFDFTKTGQQPYDIAVTSFLLIARRHIGDSLVVTTDGEDADWKEARTVVQETLGYGEDMYFQRVLQCPACRDGKSRRKP